MGSVVNLECKQAARDPRAHAEWCREQCSGYVCTCQPRRAVPPRVIDLRQARQAAEPVEYPADTEPAA